VKLYHDGEVGHLARKNPKGRRNTITTMSQIAGIINYGQHFAAAQLSIHDLSYLRGYHICGCTAISISNGPLSSRKATARSSRWTVLEFLNYGETDVKCENRTHSGEWSSEPLVWTVTCVT
jgi:hypothetical protein